MKSILKEAHRLVHGNRGDDYGHPLDDFACAVGMLNALGFRRLDRKGNVQPLAPTDHPVVMVCVKLAREWSKPKRDNRVDGAGYFETMEMVEAELERRGFDSKEKS